MLVRPEPAKLKARSPKRWPQTTKKHFKCRRTPLRMSGDIQETSSIRLKRNETPAQNFGSLLGPGSGDRPDLAAQAGGRLPTGPDSPRGAADPEPWGTKFESGPRELLPSLGNTRLQESVQARRQLPPPSRASVKPGPDRRLHLRRPPPGGLARVSFQHHRGLGTAPATRTEGTPWAVGAQHKVLARFSPGRDPDSGPSPIPVDPPEYRLIF